MLADGRLGVKPVTKGIWALISLNTLRTACLFHQYLYCRCQPHFKITQIQRLLNDLYGTMLSRSRMICLLPHPSPSPLSRQEARPAIHRKTEKDRQLADGRG
jgi:hypothetical protein